MILLNMSSVPMHTHLVAVLLRQLCDHTLTHCTHLYSVNVYTSLVTDMLHLSCCSHGVPAETSCLSPTRRVAAPAASFVDPLVTDTKTDDVVVLLSTASDLPLEVHDCLLLVVCFVGPSCQEIPLGAWRQDGENRPDFAVTKLGPLSGQPFGRQPLVTNCW